jgi:hypothetical protein
MWADHLPRQFDNTIEAEERSLMYVGITRPEDFLAISASGYSTFISEIENSHKVDELMFMCVVRVLFWSLGHDDKPNFSLPRLIIEFT